MTLTPEQTAQLLRPINPRRVLKRGQAGRQFSYLAQHDVRAMLIRIFGFGGFSLTTNGVNVIVCEKNDKSQWEVSVMVTMTLDVHDVEGIYSETAVGSSTQPSRGEALDMATKTASSDAMKRCAMNLGDQFGLSLYENGSTQQFVKSLVKEAPGDPVEHPVTSNGDEENLIEAAAQVVTAPNAPDDVLDEAEAILAGALEAEEVVADNQEAQGDDFDAALAALRAIAPIADNGRRLTELVAWREQYWADHNLAITQVKGEDMTIGRLCELVMKGEFVQ